MNIIGIANYLGMKTKCRKGQKERELARKHEKTAQKANNQKRKSENKRLVRRQGEKNASLSL
jgi:hypothetical protein